MRAALSSLVFALSATSSWLIPAIQAAPADNGRAFTLKENYVGRDFYDQTKWKYETIDDFTHGRVNNIDIQTAIRENVTWVDENNTKFVMRADDQLKVPQGSRGRDTVRPRSQVAYNEQVLVIDVEHVPTGCGVWPAFWTMSNTGPWPKGGEINIMENYNLGQSNYASMHTLPQCTVPQTRAQTAQTVSTNCDTSFNNDQGCITQFEENTHGTSFNANGGGYYVMSRTKAEGVKVWFWKRWDEKVPTEVAYVGKDGNQLRPDESWGEPHAYYPADQSCDYDSHFDAHVMYFDVTLCGDNIEQLWPTSGCASYGKCSDFVDSNPSAFNDAYWEINSIRIYA